VSSASPGSFETLSGEIRGMARSVVLISGGIASATTAALAADEGEAVWLHVDYRQRNARPEAAAVDALAEHFKPAQVVRVCMDYWASLGDFAMLAGRDRLVDAMAIRDTPDMAYIPGLLSSLLAAGLALATSVQADRVFAGLVEDRGVGEVPTHQLYPDRSREAVAAWNWQFQVASDGTGRPFRLEAPLIASRQGDLALLAHRLGVPFERTWSCYRSGAAPCRRCYGCCVRAAGFLQLGMVDPLLAVEAK
jgi:7-cyano-7-deazaguanine synthase